ncbi:MAG: diguanylate cyclase [Ectobacillus sp.]
MEKEWKRNKRQGTPLSMIMIDIDFFKQFNDIYGHLAGDDCLQRVAKTLKETAKRPRDLVARYGGEEFVILLPETSEHGALAVATSLQNNIRALKIPHEKSKIDKYVTISAGYAPLTPNNKYTPEDLISFADKALYLYKYKLKKEHKTFLLKGERVSGNA